MTIILLVFKMVSLVLSCIIWKIFSICEYWLRNQRRREIIYTINTNVLPVFTSSQGITYVSIEHALEILDENGNYKYTYNEKTYDIYINTWNVSLVTRMTYNTDEQVYDSF